MENLPEIVRNALIEEGIENKHTSIGERSPFLNDKDSKYMTLLEFPINNKKSFSIHFFHDNTPIGFFNSFRDQIFQPLDSGEAESHPLGIKNEKDLYKVWSMASSFCKRLEKNMKNTIEINSSKVLSDILKQYKKANSEIKVGDGYNTRYSNGWRLVDCDSFENFMGGGSLEVYTKIARKCKNHGITHVYDIGCNCGWQAKIFQNEGIKYTGIEIEKASLDIAPQGNGINYIAKGYPFKIDVEDKQHTAAISSLCLGYLFENKQKEAYDRLAEDFRYFCGSLGPDEFSYFTSKFGVSESEKGFILWADTERVNYIENQKEAEKVKKEQNDLFGIHLLKEQNDFILPDTVRYTSVISINSFLSDSSWLSNNNWDKKIKETAVKNNKSIVNKIGHLMEEKGWTVSEKSPVTFTKNENSITLQETSFGAVFQGTQKQEQEFLECLYNVQIPYGYDPYKRKLENITKDELRKIYKDNVYYLDKELRKELGKQNDNKVFSIAQNLYNRIGLRTDFESKMDSDSIFYETVRNRLKRMEERQELMIENGKLKPSPDFKKPCLVLSRKLNAIKEYTLWSKDSHVLMRFSVKPDKLDISMEKENELMKRFVEKHKNYLDMLSTKKDVTNFVKNVFEEDFTLLYKDMEQSISKDVKRKR